MKTPRWPYQVQGVSVQPARQVADIPARTGYAYEARQYLPSRPSQQNAQTGQAACQAVSLAQRDHTYLPRQAPSRGSGACLSVSDAQGRFVSCFATAPVNWLSDDLTGCIMYQARTVYRQVRRLIICRHNIGVPVWPPIAQTHSSQTGCLRSYLQQTIAKMLLVPAKF